MSGEYALSREEALGAALVHLQSALELLDRVDAPGQIGAHIDLARCQLQELVQCNGAEDLKIDLGSGDQLSRH